MVETRPKKKHAACDECRRRKLKCDGQLPRCQRCQAEQIECVYSPQKRMGRPRKRLRETPMDDDDSTLIQTDTAFSYSAVQDEIVPNSISNGSPSFPALTEEMLQVNEDRLPDLSYDSAAWEIPAQATNTILGFNYEISASQDDLLVSENGAAIPSITPYDPALTGDPIMPTVQCACLSKMYLTLSELQALDFFAFPFVMPQLRKAKATCAEVLHCPQCPKETVSAMQNLTLSVSLMMTLVERLGRVLRAIEDEASRAQELGTKKKFRLGDWSAEARHFHTGAEDCPAAFNVELEPHEWRALAKKAVKAEVFGTDPATYSVEGLITQLEKRQEAWHSDSGIPAMQANCFRNNRCGTTVQADDLLCLRIVKQVRTMIDVTDFG